MEIMTAVIICFSNVNLGIQAAYNYKHRYYFDFSGAVVHSGKLPEGNRNASFTYCYAGLALELREIL